MKPVKLEAKRIEHVQKLQMQIEQANVNQAFEVADKLTNLVSSYTDLAKVFVNLAVFRWKQEEEDKALKDKKNCRS